MEEDTTVSNPRTIFTTDPARKCMITSRERRRCLQLSRACGTPMIRPTSNVSSITEESAYISSMEVENLQLREALVYAEKGWRDALDLAREEKEKLPKYENSLEIRSLQLELDSIHRSLLRRRQNADAEDASLQATTSKLGGCVLQMVNTFGYHDAIFGVEEKEKQARDTEDEDIKEQTQTRPEDEDDMRRSLLEKMDSHITHLEALHKLILEHKKSGKKKGHKAKDAGAHGTKDKGKSGEKKTTKKKDVKKMAGGSKATKTK